MDEAEKLADIFARSAALKTRVAAEHAAGMLAMVGVIADCLAAGGKVFFCGNGGSAADAQHLATELLVRLRGGVERPSWPAIALTLDPAALSAGGNDYGFEMVFARPLSGLGRAGDVLVAITTSGRSPNVVRALEAAAALGIRRLGLLGGSGHPAAGLCEHAIVVPSSETARVQETHITIGHALLELVEDRLVGRS
ncbi:MAG: SIS domain-containing protein [Acetobacteraceae bacterium]|nr:SIS domain-containing protein [Acetobacteraceae bacterium]